MPTSRIQQEDVEQLVSGWFHEIFPQCSFNWSEDGSLEIRSPLGRIDLSVATHTVNEERVRVVLYVLSPRRMTLAIEMRADLTLLRDSIRSSIDLFLFTNDQFCSGTQTHTIH
jgi:hypothetical protein